VALASSLVEHSAGDASPGIASPGTALPSQQFPALVDGLSFHCFVDEFARSLSDASPNLELLDAISESTPMHRLQFKRT